MKDAGFEAKREIAPATDRLSARLGRYEELVNNTLERAEREDVIGRIWKKDASLWKDDESHQKIIRNSLGWLTVPDKMLSAVDEMKSFADEVRAEFSHVMVCGMGGSSLCPEVLRQTFGRQSNYPELLVLDSTDPDVIANFSEQIVDPTKCLFVVASKSGTTTEPIAFHRYWYEQVSKRTATPGNNFIAITDPGTLMETTAREERFRRAFINQPDIGGRYSALSYFGLTPASLMGLDVNDMLRRATEFARSCSAPATQNVAARLGAIIASCATEGRDKLTIVTNSELSAVGLWIEQLVAESTGKEGKGIVTVVGEALGASAVYGDDRVFVVITTGAVDEQTSARLAELEAAGHPVVCRQLNDAYDLGAEFFLWEMATAFAGWHLAINPFDQPNVQESKDATKALLEKYTSEGRLPDENPSAVDGTLSVFSNEPTSDGVTAGELVKQHVARIKAGDYVALLAYVEETAEFDAALQKLRITLRDKTRCAVTTGYGPRFLHSTGQLHKGGPNTGVFFQLTAPDRTDFPVPGSPYTFSILKQAQALGDFQALVAHGRRAIRVDLGPDVLAGLAKLRSYIDADA